VPSSLPRWTTKCVGVRLCGMGFVAEGSSAPDRLMEQSALLGKKAFGASPTSGQADDLSSRAVSVTRRDFCTMSLTETLMLLMSREFCCAGMVLRGGASLRHRRHRWLYFVNEGSRGPEVLRAGREHRVRGQQRHGRNVRKGATRPKLDPRLLRYRRCGTPGHVAAADV
jgi:hypothetical protein